tara:strand:- start:249 stop:1226 length:978 start_codon:yes stop_codon:yes gene_type:complete
MSAISMRKKFLSIFIILLIFIAPLASSESNSDFTVDNKEPEMTTGDYFLYDLDMTGMLDSMEDEDVDEVLENSNSGMRMEYGGDSCLQTGWDDCNIGLMTWEMNLTMIFSEGSGIDNDRAVMLMKLESTQVSSETKSQMTSINSIDMWFTIDNESYHSETVMTEVSVTTTESVEPESVNVGDTWTTEETVETTVNEKSRMNGDAWEHEEEIVETENITTNYNAESVSNVYVGSTSYQTMKIKSEEIGLEEMAYTYTADSGMPIKMEYYEEGSLQMIATLTEYSWTNEPSQASETDLAEENALPGFTMLSVIASSVLAVYFVARKQ